MKWESHQLRLTNESNYLPPGYFLLVLTKNIFFWQWRAGGSWKHFWIPWTLGASSLFLKMGHWEYGALEKERGLRLEGKGSPGVRSTGVRSTGVRGPDVRGPGVRSTGVRCPGVRSKSKTMKDTVHLQSAPSDRDLELPKPRPGSAQGWCCLCLPPESLLSTSCTPQPVFTGIKVFLPAGDTPAWGQCPLPVLSMCPLTWISPFPELHCKDWLLSAITTVPVSPQLQVTAGWAWGWYFIDTAVWQFVVFLLF